MPGMTCVMRSCGVTVIQHPTLAARDAWAARGGWISERQVTAITYSSRFGEVARNTVTPEMLLLETADRLVPVDATA